MLRTEGVAVDDDLPDFDAALCALPLLLGELFLIGTRTGQLKIEGVKVDGENAVLGAVPPYLRRLDPQFGGF